MEKGASVEKYLRLRRALVKGFYEVLEEESLDENSIKAVKQRIAGELFWNIGYNIFWQNGEKRKALDEYRAGLRITPLDLSMWKTYFLARLRS